jgi:hypothetical protein
VKNNEQDNSSDSFSVDHEPVKVYDTKGIVWRQQGPALVGHKDGITYHAHIGMDKVLTGIDEKGMPIIRRKDGKKEG